jgi:hypothetical protein
VQPSRRELINLPILIPCNDGDVDILDMIGYFDDECHSPASLAFLSQHRKLSSVLWVCNFGRRSSAFMINAM